MSDKTITEKLVEIQAVLKAPKGQVNQFGGYRYRSCEDILQAAKVLTTERGLLLKLDDDIVEINGRVYVKATASLTDGEKTLSTTAFAREEESKKGMDASQLTGSTSSYARKYALNGLFCIDDTKDADTQDNTQHETTLDEGQVANLQALIDEVGAEHGEAMLKWAGVSELSDVPAGKYKMAVKALESKRSA